MRITRRMVEPKAEPELSDYISCKENWLKNVLDKLGWTVEGLQKVLVS